MGCLRIISSSMYILNCILAILGAALFVVLILQWILQKGLISHCRRLIRQQRCSNWFGQSVPAPEVRYESMVPHPITETSSSIRGTVLGELPRSASAQTKTSQNLNTTGDLSSESIYENVCHNQTMSLAPCASLITNNPPSESPYDYLKASTDSSGDDETFKLSSFSCLQEGGNHNGKQYHNQRYSIEANSYPYNYHTNSYSTSNPNPFRAPLTPLLLHYPPVYTNFLKTPPPPYSVI